MSLELLYTSAPKGLKPGSRGFCTVAMTQGMPPQLVDRLEALSGYRQIFAPQDPHAGLNPVACSHLKISMSGRNYHVLSRVSAAGLDYSQRTNKIAHHVVLDANEVPAAGPAWLLAMPGFMTAAWDQTTRLLPPRSRPPAGNLAPAVCQRWQQTTGDAGWGGVPIDAAIKNPKGLVTLIFKPGQDPLPLLAESLALLPPEMRWQATFSTYFTKLPPGVECRWRCVVEGSPEANAAAGVVINLCHPLGPPPAGEYVAAARTGRVPVVAKPSRSMQSEAPDDSELARLLGDPIAPKRAASASGPVRTAVEPTDWPGNLQPLPPMLPAGMAANPDSKLSLRRFRKKESAQWPYIVGLIAVALVMIGGGIAIYSAMSGGSRPDPKRTVANAGEADAPSAASNPSNDSAAIAPKQNAEQDEALRKRKEETRKAAAKAPQDADDAAKETAKKKPEEAHQEEAKRTAEKAAKAEIEANDRLHAVIDAIKRLPDGVTLPKPGSTAPLLLDNVKIPNGMRCTIEFFGSDRLPGGKSFSTKPTKEKAPGLAVWLASPSAVVPTIKLASFRVTVDGLQFNWEDGAQSSQDNAAQIWNSALRVSIIGNNSLTRAKLLSLRAPAIGPAQLDLQKAVSRDEGELLKCENIKYPPGNGTVLYVEFSGRKQFTPTRSESNPSAFEIDGRLHFDVRPTLTDRLVMVRVKYLGVYVPWKLPQDDPLQKQLQPPDKPTRIQAPVVAKFIDHFAERLKSLGTTIVTKQNEEKDAAKDKDRQQELSDAIKDLKAEEKQCSADLNDAKSLHDLLVGMEKEHCGYRVYFVVKCGKEDHNVDLVRVNNNGDVNATHSTKTNTATN